MLINSLAKTAIETLAKESAFFFYPSLLMLTYSVNNTLEEFGRIRKINKSLKDISRLNADKKNIYSILNNQSNQVKSIYDYMDAAYKSGFLIEGNVKDKVSSMLDNLYSLKRIANIDDKIDSLKNNIIEQSEAQQVASNTYNQFEKLVENFDETNAIFKKTILEKKEK